MQPEADSSARLSEARDLLAAWQDGLVQDDAVVAWADDMIERASPASLPEWLLDLSMFGPLKCMKRPSSDFIAVPSQAFRLALALRARLLDLRSYSQVQTFAKWAANACIGEDLDDPIVQFGYQLNHLWCD